MAATLTNPSNSNLRNLEPPQTASSAFGTWATKAGLSSPDQIPLPQSSLALAATGSTITDGAPIPVASPVGIVTVTGANGTVGVGLPVVAGPMFLVIVNTVGGSALKVWPPVASGQINGGTAGAFFSLAGGKNGLFVCADPTATAPQWYVVLTA